MARRAGHYRVLGLAEYPAKVINRNPVPASAKPKKRTEVALQFIYPDEDAQALRCTEVDDSGSTSRVLYG